LALDRHRCEQVRVSCERSSSTDAHNLTPPWYDENNTNAWVLEDVEKRIPAVVSEPVRDCQRVLIENFDKARRISLGRGIHGPGRIDARDHDEWATLYPGFAVHIDVIDHLGNLAWKIGSKDRLDLSGIRNRHLGLIHGGT